VAKATGYKNVVKVDSIEGVRDAIRNSNDLTFIEVSVKMGDIAEPQIPPLKGKEGFMEFMSSQ